MIKLGYVGDDYRLEWEEARAIAKLYPRFLSRFVDEEGVVDFGSFVVSKAKVASIAAAIRLLNGNAGFSEKGLACAIYSVLVAEALEA